MPAVFAIEGIDRVGKSTLIGGIQEKLGFYQVIHFSKPLKLEAYAKAYIPTGVPPEFSQAYHYQSESFRNSMLLAKSGARIIFDRWYLGEYVYSPLYRGYSGEYVFELEKTFKLHKADNIRLILLIEDFTKSNHFQDDGESLGPTSKRAEEQERFFEAFIKSKIADKKIICVTDKSGAFKNKNDILAEALSF